MMWRRRWRRRMWRRSFEAYIHMSARACDALGIPFILCTYTRGKLGVVRAAQRTGTGESGRAWSAHYSSRYAQSVTVCHRHRGRGTGKEKCIGTAVGETGPAPSH